MENLINRSRMGIGSIPKLGDLKDQPRLGTLVVTLELPGAQNQEVSGPTCPSLPGQQHPCSSHHSNGQEEAGCWVDPAHIRRGQRRKRRRRSQEDEAGGGQGAEGEEKLSIMGWLWTHRMHEAVYKAG